MSVPEVQLARELSDEEVAILPAPGVSLTDAWDSSPIVVFEGPAGTGTGRLMFTSSVYWCPSTSKEKTHVQIIIIDTCESTTFDHSFHL